MGGSLLSGMAQSKSQKAQQQASEQDQELNFQRQAWLAQQQRAWQLQDRQFKQQAIGGFQNMWNTGGEVKPPSQDAQLSQLDNFDPNKKGALGPVSYTQQPPAQLPTRPTTGPLGQLLNGRIQPVNAQ